MDKNKYLAGGAAILLCLCAAANIVDARRRRRRFKVRPINRARRVMGNFQYYLKMKEQDPEQFFKYTRMTVRTFDKLMDLIKTNIKKQRRSDGISPEERLIITLQYLSQGSTMQSLAWTFNVGITTIHKIIFEVCGAIWRILSPQYLKSPSSEEEWKGIEANFHNIWNFPHCIGAMDGKHVTIQAPAKSGSLYYNYKKQFSIVLLAACDANYKFTFVDIGAYGSQSDGGVLRNSVFGKRLEDQTLGIPRASRLPGLDMDIPYVFVADAAFPLKRYIMSPYPGRNLLEQEKIFNYRLSRARQVIENTFGILVARWRILRTTICANADNVDIIIKAVVVLHNYCQVENATEASNMYCPTGYVDSTETRGTWRDETTPLQSIHRVGANIAARALYEIRNNLARYFTSAYGMVSWQDKVITGGSLLND